MGIFKFNKKDIARAKPTSHWTPVLVEGPRAAHYLSQPKAGKEPLVYLANGRTLIQELVPAFSTIPHLEVPGLPDDSFVSEDLGRIFFGDGEDIETPRSPRKQGGLSPSKQRKEDQWTTWQEKIIPGLYTVFLELWHKTMGLRDTDGLKRPSVPERRCPCDKSVRLSISVIAFTTIADVEIEACGCYPAAEQLLRSGLFPSAPLRPSIAVDLRVLEFAMKLFVRMLPNNTAWTASLEDFLSSLGYTLENKGALRRHFASALEWYNHLRHQVDHALDDQIEIYRQAWLERQSVDKSGERQEAGDPPSPQATAPNPDAGRERGRREYLRQRCAACFGNVKHDASATADIFVCVDACFTQKRNKGAADPAKFHPNTHFIPEPLSVEMEHYVDAVRDTKPANKTQPASKKRKATVEEVPDEEDAAEDGYEYSLKVPRSVLDACEASFTAADQKREKASTQFYNDTALMALLCRHDRVLWLVNMHSAGEKQFNVWLLLETLFQHLPPDITVGLLYDIACQLERSALRWGFLDRYIKRLTFAVAVFHAFGHDWACQLINHPRKRVGFGFTDGEGCERFWHSISHLISLLRVSSYHHRLYTLDTQVKHTDEETLFKHGEWNHRRALHSREKRRAALEVLAECGESREYLKKQWAEQVRVQTKLVARRSKTRGKKAVAAVLALRQAKGICKGRVEDCESEALEACENGDAAAIVLTKAALTSARAALEKTKKDLGRKEAELGVTGREELKKMHKSKYFELRMNACAMKVQLRDSLRSRKFELSRPERHIRRQQQEAQGVPRNEQKLQTHTKAAVKKRQGKINRQKNKYNELCDLIAKEISKKRALAGAIPPDKIKNNDLYNLDVDDAIWQDIGLDGADDSNDELPPPWLADAKVRSEIQAVLQLDRADEEDAILLKERSSLRRWFAEEWEVLDVAIAQTQGAERYQFARRRKHLIRLCARWRKYLPDEEDGFLWGPSAEELADCMIEDRTAARGRDEFDPGLDEGEGDSEDFETLDAIDNADAYRSEDDSGLDDSDSDSD
ncbi:hypothetical protein C8F04DRAFT_1254251 [Mycena alexandri]|uniref:CxC2-like cysteine cluster KDZ transposase-associated domain-containing protein n=1 Tax=Mycena alexandri TaxID=1745969 RepID=A0AAD6T642_9AGAR|nr:hypothetical protein C8F04DRAFT_1254251 [Mycena alexandri]